MKTAGRQVLRSAVGHLPQIQALLRFLPAAQSPIEKEVTFTYGGEPYTVPLGALTGSANTVAQRTREIGLRMALGAAPDRVRGMVLRQVAIMTLAGSLVGLAGAIGIGKGAQSILFQMTVPIRRCWRSRALQSRSSCCAPASSPRTVRHEWIR
jgi:hypothetical protein